MSSTLPQVRLPLWAFRRSVAISSCLEGAWAPRSPPNSQPVQTRCRESRRGWRKKQRSGCGINRRPPAAGGRSALRTQGVPREAPLCEQAGTRGIRLPILECRHGDVARGYGYDSCPASAGATPVGPPPWRGVPLARSRKRKAHTLLGRRGAP